MALSIFTGKNQLKFLLQFKLSTVIEELAKDPSKRFSFAEVGYITRWLEGRPMDGPQVRLFKKLVADGQIEFIGGGWVQVGNFNFLKIPI